MKKWFYTLKAAHPAKIIPAMLIMIFLLSTAAIAGQPTPYERQADFSDHSENYPDEPHNGTSLDAEFDAVKETLDETLENLGLIQRDDGGLGNATVGEEQLKPSLLAQLGSSTVWSTATAYAVDNVVFHENAVFICATSHTSGTFQTDYNSGKWLIVVDYSGDVLSSTSASSVAIGTGTKSFTIEENKYYDSGDYVLVVSEANPGTDYMFGTVTSYSGTTLTINSLVSGGSGSRADWSVRVSGPRGVQGPSGSVDFSTLSSESTAVDGDNDQLLLYDASEGGGTTNKITPNNLLALSVIAAPQLTTPALDDSYFVYDLSATSFKRIQLSDIFKSVSLLTADTTPVATADYLLTYDTSATSAKKALVSDVFKGVNDLTEDTTPVATADYLLTYDTSATSAKKVLLKNVFKTINDLTADSTPDTAADYVVTYDNSASEPKKVLLSNISGSTSGRLLGIQVFTSSGTWTKPAGAGSVKTTVVGGGGGGASNSDSGTAAGGAGGTSSFGSFCSATGGSGGSISGVYGGGGIGSSGDLNIKGESGAAGGGSGGVGGSGGSSTLGGGASGEIAGTGVTGGVYGGGGSGEWGFNSSTAGGGGGGGGTCIRYITSGLSSTEAVTVGAGGTASSGGGAGAAGVVIVESYSE